MESASNLPLPCKGSSSSPRMLSGNTSRVSVSTRLAMALAGFTRISRVISLRRALAKRSPSSSSPVPAIKSFAQRLNAPIGSLTGATSRLAKRESSPPTTTVFHSVDEGAWPNSTNGSSVVDWSASLALARWSVAGVSGRLPTNVNATQTTTAVRAALNTIFFIFPVLFIFYSRPRQVLVQK